MNWEVIAYGSGDFLRMVFTAVASIFGNASYLAAVQTAFFLGFLVFFIKGAIHQDVMSGVKWFLVALLLNLALLVPKATVVVTDRILPSSSAVVNNVPLGLAATAGFFSYTGDWFSRAFETVFTVPNAVRYTHNGLLFGHKVLEATRTMVIPEERTYLNFTEFFGSCVVVDGVGHDRFTWEAVLEANDLLAFFSTNVAEHAARFKYITSTGVQQILPCRSGFVGSLQPDLLALTDGIMSTGIRGFIANNSTVAAALAKYKSDLPPAIQYLTGMTITPESMVLQSSLSNTMGNAILKMSRSVDDAAFAMQYARLWAENERRTTYQTMGRIAEEKLPLLRSLIEAFLYAIFPIITLTALVMPTAVPFTYVTTLLWINLWPPLYAILNFFISYYTKGVLTELSSIYGSGFNAMASTQLMEYVTDMVATSGYLVSSLPIIAWMLVSRSGALAAMAVSRIMQGYDTSVAHAAEQLTRGAGQIDGVEWRKTHDAAVSLDNNVQTSTLTTGGGTVTMTGEGRQYYQQMHSNAAVGVDFAYQLTTQTSQEVAQAHQQVEQSRETFTASTASLGQTVADLANYHNQQTDISEKTSEGHSILHEHISQDLYSAVDEYADQNNLKLSHEEKLAIAGTAALKANFDIVAGHVGGATDITGQMSAAAHELRDRADVHTYTDKFMESTQYSDALRSTAAYAIENAQNLTDTDGQQFTSSVRTALNEHHDHSNQYEQAQANLETAHERHSNALALSETITVSGIDAVKDFAVTQGGMTPSEFFQMLDGVRDGNYAATEQFHHMAETMRQLGFTSVANGLQTLDPTFSAQGDVGELRTDPRAAYDNNQPTANFGPPPGQDSHFDPGAVENRVLHDQAAMMGASDDFAGRERTQYSDQWKDNVTSPVTPHAKLMDDLARARQGVFNAAESIVHDPWTVSPQAAAALGGYGGGWSPSEHDTALRHRFGPALTGPPRMEQDPAALYQGVDGPSNTGAGLTVDYGLPGHAGHDPGEASPLSQGPEARTPPLDTGFWPAGSAATDAPAAGGGAQEPEATAPSMDPMASDALISHLEDAPQQAKDFTQEAQDVMRQFGSDSPTDSGNPSAGSAPAIDVETPPPEAPLPHPLDRPDAGLIESRDPTAGFGDGSPVAADIASISSSGIEQDAAALHATSPGESPATLRDPIGAGAGIPPARDAAAPVAPRVPEPPAFDAAPLVAMPGIEQDPSALHQGGAIERPPLTDPTAHSAPLPLERDAAAPLAPRLPEAPAFDAAPLVAMPGIEQDPSALRQGGAIERPPLTDPTAHSAPLPLERDAAAPLAPRLPEAPAFDAAPLVAMPGIEHDPSALHQGGAIERPNLRPLEEAGTGQTQTYASIIAHEDFRTEAYKDGNGWSIGYGHSLTFNDTTFADGTPIPEHLTKEDALRLLREDIAQAEHDARSLVSEERWDSLSEVRKGVIIELAYQHGYNNTKKFEQFFEAVEKEDWQRAAGELIDSDTFKTEATSARMATLATRMATDDWEKGLK